MAKSGRRIAKDIYLVEVKEREKEKRSRSFELGATATKRGCSEKSRASQRRGQRQTGEKTLANFARN